MLRKYGTILNIVTSFRISEAAELLGVSDDTVRRLVAAGDLQVGKDDSGRQSIDGRALALWSKRQAAPPVLAESIGSSARNRLVGLVTAIQSDEVMSQVEMQCGRYRIVSLMSTEAVRDLKLEVGSLAVAVVKATMVIVETPKES